MKTNVLVEEARQRFEGEGLNLMKEVKKWMSTTKEELSKEQYDALPHDKAIAWNWWLDKLMDHVRIVARNDGIVDAARQLVGCFFSFQGSHPSDPRLFLPASLGGERNQA